MESMHKRSLWGYSPAEVEKNINQVKAEFAKNLEELEKVLHTESAEAETLRLKIRLLKEALSAQDALEKEIGDMLLNAYMKATEEVQHTLSETAGMDHGRAEEIARLENLHFSLKNGLKELVDEVQTTLRQFELRLNSGNIRKAGDCR